MITKEQAEKFILNLIQDYEVKIDIKCGYIGIDYNYSEPTYSVVSNSCKLEDIITELISKYEFVFDKYLEVK